LFAASFPKFGYPAFAWIALAPAIVAIATSAGSVSLRRSASLGFVTGLVYFAGTLYWVVEVMHRYGDLAWPLAAPIGLLLVSYLAIYTAVWAVLLRLAVRKMGVSGVWLAPAFWVAMEWVRGSIGGGFPWALLGSSQASVVPIVQLASVTGVFGLSALVALVGTAAAVFSLTHRRARSAAGAGDGFEDCAHPFGVARHVLVGLWRVRVTHDQLEAVVNAGGPDAHLIAA